MDTAIEAPDFTRWPLKQALYRRNLKQAHIAKALGKIRRGYLDWFGGG